jgi:ribosome-binding factor A
MSINNNFPINKSQRQLRVGELLRKELSETLVKNDFHHSDLSNFSITVSQVVVTPDMKWARAFVSPLGGENFDEVMDYLNKNVFSIQKIIASKVRLKRMPKLVFIEDKSFDFASNISQKIKGLN